MTPPDFSVLLLAWDDADPSVAVLGGAALPPTLPLVYQLAAQQPVVAVFPHLPAGAAPADAPEATPEANAAAELKTGATTAAVAAPEAAKGTFDTAADLPGVQLLTPIAATEGTTTATAPVLPSRIIGLADLTPTGSSLLAVPPALTGGENPTGLRPAAPRSQWPTGANSPAASRPWQAPAAPYLGAAAVRVFPPPPPSPPRPGASESAAATPVEVAGRAIQPRPHPQAGDLSFDPDPELPAVRRPAVFDEPTEEIGSAEALDLAAPEDNLTPDEPVPAAAAVAPAVAPEPAEALVSASTAAPTPRVPTLDGLNFRMIQYARQAAQLVRGRADFGVIYAPSWPAWLAALEIRNSSGRPLVLYAAGLAADLPNPAERGWQLEMERMTMRRAQLILVPTEALHRRLKALYGSTIGEVRVVAAANETAVQQALREVAAG